MSMGYRLGAVLWFLAAASWSVALGQAESSKAGEKPLEVTQAPLQWQRGDAKTSSRRVLAPG